MSESTICNVDIRKFFPLSWIMTFYCWIFPVNSPPHWFNSPHTIMGMRNNKRRNVLTHARVNFSQSETSSRLLLLRGELNFELLLWRGVNRKDPIVYVVDCGGIATSVFGLYRDQVLRWVFVVLVVVVVVVAVERISCLGWDWGTGPLLSGSPTGWPPPE